MNDKFTNYKLHANTLSLIHYTLHCAITRYELFVAVQTCSIWGTRYDIFVNCIWVATRWQ